MSCVLLTFPKQQTLRGHRGPDHETVGLVERVGQTLQFLGPIHPRPQGHSLLRQREFGSMGKGDWVLGQPIPIMAAYKLVEMGL